MKPFFPELRSPLGLGVNALWLSVCLLAPQIAPGALLTASQPRDPVGNFDSLWRTFDEKYGLFQVKGVDWHSLYSQYRPRVNAETKDDELFAVMAGLLDHLQDKHVWLAGAGMVYNCRLKAPRTAADGQQRLESLRASFSEPLIKDQYLKRNQIVEHGMGIFSGLLPDNKIGYLRIARFEANADKVGEIIDRCIEQFKGTKGLILDVRGNTGGTDRSVNAAANRFADQRRLFMISQVRNGPRHEDFGPPQQWYLEPSPKGAYTQPIVLLMNRHTFSAGETFCMAMRVLPNVTLMGEATAGAFSDAQDEKLPNEWEFTYSIGVWRDAAGRIWEGKGIPPDVEIQETNDRSTQKSDKMLVAAFEHFKGVR